MVHSKECFKCKAVKPLIDFYKHAGMADGHLNKCKECNKKDVIKNRLENIYYYRQYDKKRANLPKRVEARLEYAKTSEGIASQRKGSKTYDKKYPYKKTATVAINNAIRSGKIVRPLNCENCGSENRIEGHHDDYSKPYSVRWLCVFCHSNWHKNNKPIYPF